MAAGNFSSQASSPDSGGSPGPQTGAQGSPQALLPQSFYGLLQLAEDASLEELRQAFRRQSKRLHPDTTSLPAAVAQESFSQLRQAYVILLDPERRRAYDASLAAAAQAAAGGPDPSLGTSPGPASRQGVGEGLPRPDSVRRTLSGGEWFALLLLGLALVFCLVLGVGLAWMRGTELVREPSWWPAQETLEPSQPAPSAPSLSLPRSSLQAPSIP